MTSFLLSKLFPNSSISSYCLFTGSFCSYEVIGLEYHERAPLPELDLLDNRNVCGKLHIEQQIDAPVQLEEQRSLFSGKYV